MMDHLINVVKEVPWQQILPSVLPVLVGAAGGLLSGLTSGALADRHNHKLGIPAITLTDADFAIAQQRFAELPATTRHQYWAEEKTRLYDAVRAQNADAERRAPKPVNATWESIKWGLLGFAGSTAIVYGAEFLAQLTAK